MRWGAGAPNTRLGPPVVCSMAYRVFSLNCEAPLSDETRAVWKHIQSCSQGSFGRNKVLGAQTSYVVTTRDVSHAPIMPLKEAAL